MDKEYFLNGGIPPLLHFEPSLSTSTIPTWQSLPSEQPSDCFLNPSWENSTDQYTHFESVITSMVSSPGASNSAVSNDSFAIRELIGKLGTICNSGEIPPPFPALRMANTPYIGGGTNSITNNSCYSTSSDSPPKLYMPIMDQFVKENTPNLGNSRPFNSTLQSLSTDPGFAERAAKFSGFGNRSFNSRTSQFTGYPYRPSNPLVGSGKLLKVSSSPSLNTTGPPPENKNSTQTQMEMRSSNGSILGSDKKLSKLSGPAASSNEESSVSEQIPSGETGLKSQNELNLRKRKAISKGKAMGDASIQSANVSKVAEADNDDWNSKRYKPTEGCGNENAGVKTEEETKGNGARDGSEKQAKANPETPEPPKDYIHVRARRGQATDNHSLAERVRREKISERMKLLQDLVPGCNKVTGKALMLDEIINYVQSLQNQVEFLSMKLSSVNPSSSLPQPMYGLDSSAAVLYRQQPQKNPQVHNNNSKAAVTQYSVDPSGTTLCGNLGAQLPPVDEFGGGDLPQFQAFCEDDLQSIVQMGFGQNTNRDTSFHSQSFPVLNQNIPQ